jgi:hypothetical protein
MKLNINDRVLANTHLMQCRLLGDITNIVGDTYYIKLLFPIRGVSEVQCKFYQLSKVEEKQVQPVKNKKVRGASNKIIERLQAIADHTEQRQQENLTQPVTHNKTRDIQHSNNWLDYMKDNEID